jgi:DNA-binding PadR family transcriptional regulator
MNPAKKKTKKDTTKSGTPGQAMSFAWFSILSCVRHKVVSAKTIRLHLEARGFLQSSPSFYLMLGRMEQHGLIVGQTRTTVVGPQPINERWFETLPKGVDEFERLSNVLKADLQDTLWVKRVRRQSDAEVAAERSLAPPSPGSSARSNHG